MRIRRESTNASIPHRVEVKTTSYPSGSVTTNVQHGTIGNLPFTAKYMSDNVTPKFARKRSKGEVIMNNMTSASSDVFGDASRYYDLNEYRPTTNGWSLINVTQVRDLTAITARMRIPYPLSLAERYENLASRSVIQANFDFSRSYDQEQILLARCLANASEAKAQILVTIAELNKTIDMFGSLAAQARRFDTLFEKMSRSDRSSYRTARNNKFRHWRSLGTELASSWLAYRYGVMATYYDVMSWVDAARSIRKRSRARFTSSVSTQFDSGYTESMLSSGSWATEFAGSQRARATHSTAGCITQINLEIGAARAFGVYNIISSAWELIPYSFVLDWFVDVGTRLAAVESSILRPVLGSWIVHRHNLVERHHYREDGKDHVVGSNRFHASPMVDTANLVDVCKIVERKANPELSILPRVKVNLNLKKLVDSVALLSQYAARHKNRG